MSDQDQEVHIQRILLLAKNVLIQDRGPDLTDQDRNHIGVVLAVIKDHVQGRHDIDLAAMTDVLVRIHQKGADQDLDQTDEVVHQCLIESAILVTG